MIGKVLFACESCKRQGHRRVAEIRYRGKPARFCSLKCAGVARRKHKTAAQKKAEKAAYDRAYRAKNAGRIAAHKASYFQATYDPAVARRERKKRMRRHVEYCRRYYADPVRKATKVAYDERRRDSAFGPFGEAHRILIALKQAVRKAQPNKYERAKARGYYDRNSQQRKRDAQISRW